MTAERITVPGMDSDFTHNCQELAPSSVPFSVRSIADDSKGLPTQSLALFDAVQLPEGGSVAFVGGPAYALDWAPDGRHLAVAAHRVVRPVHQLLRLYRGAAHIQIWRVSEGAVHLAPVQILAHNGECTWDLKWRPGIGAALLAAALGDGRVQLYLPPLDEPGSAPVAEVSVREGEAANDGVRAVSWSDDGRTLAAGTVQGCVELYGVRDADGALLVHIMARVRVHEGVVSALQWVQPFVLATVSFDGTQRIRDVRELTIDIDRTSDGPGWHFATVCPENSVVMSCSDGGYMRFTRVAGLAGSAGPSDVKKTRLSTGSLRTMVNTEMPAEGSRKAATVLYLGGMEGKLTIAAIPRPLWEGGGCRYRKSKFSTVMQWGSLPGAKSLLDEPELGGGTVHEVSEIYRVRHSELELCIGSPVAEDAKTKKKTKRSYQTAPGDINICAEAYDQRVCISRVALSNAGGMVAAATHAGLVTVLPVSYDQFFGATDIPVVKPKCKPAKPKATKKKEVVVKVKRKRGRPRKHPLKEPKEQTPATPKPEPKKRGRPRKHPPKKPKGQKPAPTQPDPKAQVEEEEIVESSPKRRRKETARKASYTASRKKAKLSSKNKGDGDE